MINVDVIEEKNQISEEHLNITDNVDIVNFEDVIMNLSATDITNVINVDKIVTTLNVRLETYDETWPYWKVVLDFFYSHDSDVFGAAFY